MKQILQSVLTFSALLFLATGCQKMDRPALGDFIEDTNPPGGPLKFYVAFDGTTADPLRNAVDSVKANFASDNPLTSIDGVSGKAIQGEAQKYVKYMSANDWAQVAESFTISYWYKKDGQTKNNVGGNGPEYPISFKSSNGHWSGGNFFIIMEGDNAGCAIKVMFADANVADNWFTWEGGNTIPGLLDNAWHHIALVYDAATSGMTLYIDAVANPDVKTWGTHGPINLDASKISEVRIGAGPQNNFSTDDWLSSSWKGDLDQFRLYSIPLPQTEIQNLFINKL